MFNDFAAPDSNADIERNAYNAAFHELGFRFHLDSETFDAVFASDISAAECIHQYLATCQPHLLKAYDGAFLVQAIDAKKAEHAKRGNTSKRACRHFDWAQSLGCEIGA
jgi:hypothetical protein